MKILLGVLYYEPAFAYGGPPKMVADLAREYARRGHAVTVCTTDAFDSERRLPTTEEVRDGVRVVRFANMSNVLAWRLKIFLPIGMRRWLRQHVREFDVVHLFDTRTLLNAWAAREAVRAGVPFVLSVWGSLPRGDGWRAMVKANYDRKHRDVLFGRAAALLAQNQHESALYLQYGGQPERVTLWPLAVDSAEFENLPPQGHLRTRLGIPADARVALFVGRIHQLKGLEPLIRAFHAAGVDGAHLVIVGRDDGYLDEAQRLVRELAVADRVHFAGPMYGRDAIAAYVDCDLFCITPIHFEETSLASLAACACSRPVLINDRCGIPWLEEFDAGLQVAHSESAIHAALRRALTDSAWLQKTGRNARRMVEERFFMRRIVDQAEAIYARVTRPVSRAEAGQ